MPETRTTQEIHRILTAFERYWSLHPNKSLDQLVEKLRGDSEIALSDERLLRKLNKEIR
jgi:hypothetical protein